jgi:opacity protein-like surface antigen
MARLLRWLIGAVVALAFAPSAFADDLDILRGPQTVGPPSYTRWSGFYFGGQAGYGGGNANFSGATQQPLGYALRETDLEAVVQPSTWPLLGTASDKTAPYGAFVGYNVQWQDLVLGAELNYSRTKMAFAAPSTPINNLVFTDPPTDPTLPANVYRQWLVSANAAGSLSLNDYLSLRARGGWVLGDNFLPYGFGGFVVGRANYSTRATIDAYEADTTVNQNITPPVPPPLPVPGLCKTNPVAAAQIPEVCSQIAVSPTNGSNSLTWIYGFDVGVGVDIALMQNVFLRGEIEYVHFLPMQGITLDLATARIGAGLKF